MVVTISMRGVQQAHTPQKVSNLNFDHLKRIYAGKCGKKKSLTVPGGYVTETVPELSKSPALLLGARTYLCTDLRIS